jgi:O-antigen ligase
MLNLEFNKRSQFLFYAFYVGALASFIYSIIIFSEISISVLSIIASIWFLIADKRTGLVYFIISITVINQIIFLIAGSQIKYIEYFPSLLVFLVLLYDNLVLRRKIFLLRTRYDTVVLVFSIYLIFSTFYISSDRSYGLEKFQFYIISIIFFYLPVLYTRSIDDIHKFFRAILYFGLILSLFGFFQINGFGNFLVKNFQGRFNLLKINPIWLGRYYSYAILVEIYFLRKLLKDFSINFGKISLLIALMFFQFYLIALTGSRGPFFALLIAIAYILITRYRLNFTRISTIIILIVLFFFIASSFIPQEISERLMNTTFSGRLTVIIRVLANLEAVNNFMSNILFGIGFGAYKFGGGVFHKLIYPHNVFAEILAETGVIGIILFCVIVFYPLIQFAKLKKLNPNLKSLTISLFLVSLINSCLSGHIGANYYLWFSLGIMYTVSKLRFEKQK